MADIVEKVLEKANEIESKFKSTNVTKAIDLEIDEGNLLASDVNPFDPKALK